MKLRSACGMVVATAMVFGVFSSSRGGEVESGQLPRSSVGHASDLTEAGGHLTNASLPEAIPATLRRVVPKFRPLVVVLENGRILVGYEHERLSNETIMTFVDRVGKRFKIPRKEIDFMKPSIIGMPNNYSDLLTADEVNELVVCALRLSGQNELASSK